MFNLLTSAVLASVIAVATASPLAPLAERADPFNATGIAASPTPAQIKALQQALILAPSEAERLSILLPNPPDASNITFQFVNNTVKPPTGGTIALSTLSNFPALLTTNVAMAIGFVNPCGLNTPHNHPRANEFLTVVQGTLVGGLIIEPNGGGAGDVVGQPSTPNGPIAQVNTTLTNYKGMLFPQGTTHFQFNPTCQPAIFAAAFDNSDPGRTQIARNFFSAMPDDVLITATGGDLETLDASRIAKLRGKIPNAFADIMASCAKKCGIPSA